jgi:hypothetical protein
MSDQLKFAALGEQTRTRWQKLLNSSRRELTERARRLIAIGLEACESHGPESLQARLHGGCLWICCQQADLARMLDCSERTVRNELDRLDQASALQTFPHPSKPNVIGYRIDPEALEALPETHTPDLDEIICAFAESDQVTGERQGVSPPCESSADAVAGQFAAPVAGGFAGQFAAPVAGLMNHDHEGLIEFNSNSSITHDHERPSDRDPDRRRFDAITERDVLAIAGYQILVDGVLRHASMDSRRRVQLEYFEDAVAAGMADRSELLLFASVFRCAARLNRKPDGDKCRVNNCAQWIRTVWTNRKDKPPSRLISDDRSYARELLRITSPVPESVH